MQRVRYTSDEIAEEIKHAVPACLISSSQIHLGERVKDFQVGMER